MKRWNQNWWRCKCYERGDERKLQYKNIINWCKSRIICPYRNNWRCSVVNIGDGIAFDASRKITVDQNTAVVSGVKSIHPFSFGNCYPVCIIIETQIIFNGWLSGVSFLFPVESPLKSRYQRFIGRTFYGEYVVYGCTSPEDLMIGDKSYDSVRQSSLNRRPCIVSILTVNCAADTAFTIRYEISRMYRIHSSNEWDLKPALLTTNRVQ